MTSVATSDPRIEDYLQALRDRSREPSTIETYSGNLYRLDQQLRKAGSPHGLASACTEELREAIYVPGRTPAYRHSLRTMVAGYFDHHCDQRRDVPLDYDPSRDLPTVKVPRRRSRTIPLAQLGDILARATNPYRVWFLLAAGAGLRCIEISRLDREHVSADDIWVQGKGSKERIVPTHPAVWAAVKDLPPGPLARKLDGSRASRQLVQCRGNRHLHATLGHPEVTIHRLRHLFGTEAHAAGGKNVLLTQDLLGHESPMTTQVYVDVSWEAKRAAIDALPLPV